MEVATSIPDILDPDTFANGPPHDIFDYLRENDPCHGQPNLANGGTVWSLTRHADIRDVSKDTGLFTSSLGQQFPTPAEEVALRQDTNMVWLDPPRHNRLRSFAAKAFSPRVVAQFEDWIRQLSTEILDNIQDRESIEAVSMVASELPGQIICNIMGVPDDMRSTVVQWTNNFFGRLDPEIGYEASAQAFENLRDYIFELRAIKEREPGNDMTTELLGATFKGEPITDGEFGEMCGNLMMAGYETTHSLIAQGLLLMAQDPDVRRMVEQAPPDGMGDIVDEMLRYLSPLHHMTRAATRDTELHGKKIAKDDRIVMWYAAGNRDPRVFDQPHRFMVAPDRSNHLSFGAGGPHYCLGSHLARLEAVILFDEMRKRGIRLELNGKPERARGIFVNALHKLPMRVVR